MNPLRIVIMGLAVWLIPVADAAPSELDKVGTLINRARAAADLPSGTAVIVVKGDRIIHESYHGYADIAGREKVNEKTAFYIASVTKPFFALNALLMEQDGNLDTNSSLQALVPEMNFTGFDADKVTVRDLLVHTSGLDNEPLVWATAFSGVHDASSRRQLVAATYPAEGTRLGGFDYSNVGYNILSVALDARGDAAWQERLEKNIFAPLRMAQTSAYMSAAADQGTRTARPYSLMSEKRLEALYLEKTDATMHAAGGLIATARDLSRFLIAELNEGRVDGKQVFPAEVIRRSHEQQAKTDTSYQDFQRDGYAWGWYTGDYKGQRMLHHFGGFAGYHAHLSFIPEEKIGLVVLNNEDFLSARLTSLVADLVYGTLLNEENIVKNVDARLEELLVRLQGVGETIRSQRKEISARPWLLSRPLVEYAGKYSNSTLGTVHVNITDDKRLEFIWGELRAVADGYDKPDVVRVELAPNSGKAVSFTVDAGIVTSLVINDITFVRN